MSDPNATIGSFFEKAILPLLTAVFSGGFVAWLNLRKSRKVAEIKKDGTVEVKELDNLEKTYAWVMKRLEESDRTIQELAKEKNAWMEKAMRWELQASELRMDLERLKNEFDRAKFAICYKTNCQNRQIER